MKHIWIKKIPLTLALLGLVALPLFGFGCKGGSNDARNEAAKPIKLNWWRTADTREQFLPIITDYLALHPNIAINFKQIRPEELDQTLLEALASGTGPDIVSLPNTSLKQWQDKLAPLPATTTLPYIEIKGFIKKEPVVTLKTTNSLSLKNLRDNFVDVVYQDAILDGKIYGLPVSLDTLLMFYNKYLLNAADLPVPPATWTDFKLASQKITKQDKPLRL